jgi:hypothetical protein
MKLEEIKKPSGIAFSMKDLVDYLNTQGTVGSFDPDESVEGDEKQMTFSASTMGVQLDVRITFLDKEIKVEWRGEDEDGEEVDDSQTFEAAGLAAEEVGDAIDQVIGDQLHHMMRDDEDD